MSLNRVTIGAWRNILKLFSLTFTAAATLKLILFCRQYLKYLRTLKRLSERFPYDRTSVGAGVTFLLGSLADMAKNSDRLAHYKSERFHEVEKQTGQRSQTIQLVAPVWEQRPILLTKDPVLIKHILRDEFDTWEKERNFKNALHDVLGQGLFAIDHGKNSGDHKMWSFQRKTASRIFTKKTFTGHAYRVLLKNNDKVFRNINEAINSNKGVIDIKKQIYCYTMDAIGAIGCGIDLKTLDENDDISFSKSFDSIAAVFGRRLSYPFWQQLGRIYPHERVMRKSVQVIDEFCYKVIDKRQEDTNLPEERDILSLFMKSGKTLGRKLLRDIALAFFVAGRDTTAATLSFALFLLATQPENQEKLYVEVTTYSFSR